MNGIINICLTLLVIVVVTIIIKYSLDKNKKTSEEEETEVKDDTTYTIDAMIAFVKKRLDEITKVNLYDIGLSEEELKRRKAKKYELRKALKGCTYGDVNDKRYVKELIYDLLLKEYGVNEIQVLEGLEAVRKRPGMYIGSTDKRGLHHLVWEIVDNSIDEVINGYGKKIKIILHSDHSVSVEDEGRGVPVGKHASGISTPEVIYTMLHAGGKFESSGYTVSGGLHGVGASVVNALSKSMEVTIKRDGYEYFISFKDGGKLDQPLTKRDKTNKTGTKVRFLPDDTIFSTTHFSFTTICERMQESAFLLEGLTIQIVDEEDQKQETF